MKEATQHSGKVVRQALENTVAAVKQWFAAPWNFERAATLAAIVLSCAGLFWALRWLRRMRWRVLRRRSGEGREDPVRREAGRWLRKIATDEVAAGDMAETHAQLQRLRFGPRPSWPDPPRVFRRARRDLREARRRAKLTRS
jgi:hypothetical protein